MHHIIFPLSLKVICGIPGNKIDTIFDFEPSLAVDVPTWNRHPYHGMFQKRVGTFFGKSGHRISLKMEEDDYWRRVCHEREYLRTEVYRYLKDDKIPRVYHEFNKYQSPVSMAYFWFSDILGHITPNGYLLKDLYHHKKIAFLQKIHLVHHGKGYSMYNPNHPARRILSERPDLDVVCHGHIHDGIVFDDIVVAVPDLKRIASVIDVVFLRGDVIAGDHRVTHHLHVDAI